MEDGTPRHSLNPSGFFIDDYSHLRLSYYQYGGAISDLSCDESSTRDTDMESNLTMESSLEMETNLDKTWTGRCTDVMQDELFQDFSVIESDASSDHEHTSSLFDTSSSSHFTQDVKGSSSLFPQNTSPSSYFAQDTSTSIAPQETSLFQPSSSACYQNFDDISLSDLKYEDGSSQHCLNFDDISLSDLKYEDGSSQHCLPLEEPAANMISKKYQAIPPPMFSMATMMGTISNAMNSGSGMYFKYNDTIERNSGRAGPEFMFSPQRRSTLLPTKKRFFK
ncbi:hypothetical protein O0L34_g815 [Tuta absoluta]|nr:hypothetical protein O0L34_g815 [Tuta absoluta]